MEVVGKATAIAAHRAEASVRTFAALQQAMRETSNTLAPVMNLQRRISLSQHLKVTSKFVLSGNL
jgi:hypothetical protein